jgi:hypothetical protein
MESLLQRCCRAMTTKYVRPSKLVKSLGVLFFLSILCIATNAQLVQNSHLNCTPSTSHCTSKDLAVVDVFTDAPPCATCNAGTNVTYTLKMTIHNGTKSTRTAFALYGTLSSGASIAGITGNIFVCVGAVTVSSSDDIGFGKGNQTFTVGQITFSCGQSLTLTNNLLAWTDASGTTTDRCNTFAAATQCSDIEPKCGTASSITIRQPLSAPTNTTESCTNAATGSISVTPSGGTTPYNITIGGTAYSSVTTATKSNVTGTINYTVKDAGGCSVTGQATVATHFCCTPPNISTSPANVTVCDGDQASFTATSSGGDPAPTIQWQEKVGNGSFTDISEGAPYTGTTTGTLTINPTTGKSGNQYRAVFTSAGCTSATSNAGTLTLNARQTANAGTAPGAQCFIAGGNTFVLSGSGSNGNPSWAVAPNGNPSSLGVQITNGSTFSPSVKVTGSGSVTLRLTVTSNATPSCGTATSDVTVTVNSKPGPPSVTYHPPACDASTFSITINSPIAGATYTLMDKCGVLMTGAKVGSTTTSIYTPNSNASFDFTNIQAGSGYWVVVGTAGGCLDTTMCGTCPNQNVSRATPLSETTQEVPTVVKAYPNPFSNKINFVVTTPVSGMGSLDVYNMMGQKVRTIYQGFISAGTQTFQMNSQKQQVANLIYVLRIGDKKISGRILQINQ